jgi:hypothetical protein
LVYQPVSTAVLILETTTVFAKDNTHNSNIQNAQAKTAVTKHERHLQELPTIEKKRAICPFGTCVARNSNVPITAIQEALVDTWWIFRLGTPCDGPIIHGGKRSSKAVRDIAGGGMARLESVPTVATKTTRG